MTRYIYRDLQFDPIRIRFGEAHGFRADESVAAFMGRLGRFAAAAKIDPTRLTMVTSATICEFLGIEVYRWRHLVTDLSRSPLGTPPPPRYPGGPRRGRGVTDIWCLELDIIPWLLSSDRGRDMLAEVLVQVKAELAGRAEAAGQRVRAAAAGGKRASTRSA